jgi:hypothetical protein
MRAIRWNVQALSNLNDFIFKWKKLSRPQNLRQNLRRKKASSSRTSIKKIGLRCKYKIKRLSTTLSIRYKANRPAEKFGDCHIDGVTR